MEKRDMCIYCAKWVPEIQLKSIDDPRAKYCERCYPEVLREHRNLPWNRK